MNAHKKTHSLGFLLQHFFTTYLKEERNVSLCTIAAYRDTFRLFFEFTEQQLKKRPAELSLTDIDVSIVLAFLTYLEKTRMNSIRTRNARLAALRAFMHYVSMHEPSVLATAEQILSIPVKRHERPLIGFLSLEQIEAILGAPDDKTWSGRRDRAMFATLYNSGVRVSELTAIRVSDLEIARDTSLRIQGKGRKSRSVPLWNKTSRQLKDWLAFAQLSGDEPLFPNRMGNRLSRTGVTERLVLATQTASMKCPSLSKQRVTCHVFRHSTAMHLLQSGVDITVIALWLGHESPVTTHGYIEADLSMKEKAMSSLRPPGTTTSRFVPEDKLLGFLSSL